MSASERSSGEMTCAEAGRRGGLATSARHGPDHDRRLAEATNARLTPPQRTAIARAGWRAQQAALGPAGRAAMARNAGASTLAHHGRDYYRRIVEARHTARSDPSTEGTADSSLPGEDVASRAFGGQQTSAGVDIHVTEKEWMRTLLDLFALHSWRCYHTFDSRRSAPGFPDLVCVHPRHGVVWVEVKAQRGAVSASQQSWIDALQAAGQRVDVLRPSDLLVAQALARGVGAQQEAPR